MDKSNILSQSRFQPPENWEWNLYTIDNVKIRYGLSRTRHAYDGVMVILGGLGDFGEQYFELAHECIAQNLKPIIVDMPGQGGSSRYLPDKPMRRHSDGFDKILTQLHTVFDEIVYSTAIDENDNHKRLPIFLIAHSMGGHIALRYLAEQNKSSRGQNIFAASIIVAPMVGIRTVELFPSIIASALVKLFSFFPTSYVIGGCDWFDGYRERPGFKGIFTSDPERYELQRLYYTGEKTSYLATGSPTNKWLADAVVSCKILQSRDYLKKIEIPVLVALAGEDKLVNNTSARKAISSIKNIETMEIEGAQHEIIMEADKFRGPFIDRVFTFLRDNVLNKPDNGKISIQ